MAGFGETLAVDFIARTKKIRLVVHENDLSFGFIVSYTAADIGLGSLGTHGRPGHEGSSIIGGTPRPRVFCNSNGIGQSPAQTLDAGCIFASL